MMELSIPSRKILRELLVRDEGYSQYTYYDSVGMMTIGVGRNLSSNGITLEEALYLLDNDISNCEKMLSKYFDFWSELSDVRKIVLIDMCFNLGFYKLKTFDKLIESLSKKDYKLASQEMLNSKWADQVPSRARRLANFMETDSI